VSTKKLIIALSASLLLFASCGRNYSGTYQGNEMINQGTGTQATQSALTLSLSETNGSSVSGTYQSAQGGAGTITATANGSGLSGVSLMMSNGVGGIYGMWNTAGCQQTYTGTLNSPNGNQLTGILVGTGGCYGYSGMSRSIDVTK
jgi:hypothetical protein